MKASATVFARSSALAKTSWPSLFWPRVGGQVERIGQIVDDAVEQALHALLLEGGTGNDAAELEGDRRLADADHQFVDADFGALEILVGDPVIAIRHGLDEFLAVFLGARPAGRPGSRQRGIEAEEIGGILLEIIGLHLHEVDQTPEILLGADGQEQRMGVGGEFLSHLLDAGEEIGARPGPSC